MPKFLRLWDDVLSTGVMVRLWPYRAMTLKTSFWPEEAVIMTEISIETATAMPLSRVNCAAAPWI